jgi:hypothetical protein
LLFEYGVRGQALVVVPPDGGESITFDGKWSIHRLKTFFTDHALKEEVKPGKRRRQKKKLTNLQRRKSRLSSRLL